MMYFRKIFRGHFGSSSEARQPFFSPSTLETMVKVVVSIHPPGLHPVEAVKAWHLHKEQGMSLTKVQAEVKNIQGEKPSIKNVWSSVQRVDRMAEGDLLPSKRYKNCGRKPKLAEEQASFPILPSSLSSPSPSLTKQGDDSPKHHQVKRRWLGSPGGKGSPVPVLPMS